jgi:hypothetical protein
MAHFGLKKQGRQWGLFHGNEMVREEAALTAGGEKRLDSGGTPAEMAGGSWPVYDNDREYRNVRAALKEAEQQPPLDAPEKQKERENLQKELEGMVHAFESRHRHGEAVAWDPGAERGLHDLMHSLYGLLRLTGLSLPHGPGVIGDPEGLPGGEAHAK